MANPIYRPEQARLSFHGEAGNGGGYMDNVTAGETTTGDWDGVINGVLAAGSRAVVFDGATGTLAVGNYVLLGTAAGTTSEIRKIESLGSYNGTGATGTIFLDTPTGFHHADDEIIDEVTIDAGAQTGVSWATFVPGVYESVTAPDPQLEVIPYWYVQAAGERSFSHAYKGKENFTGALSNFILLNGFSLRFPIGTVATVGTASGDGDGAINQALGSFAGDRVLTLDGVSASAWANAEYMQIGTGTTAEVRQIVSHTLAGGPPESGTVTLNAPLIHAHANDEVVAQVIAPYTHTITETGPLSSMTWNLLLQDSDGTTANNFLRKYTGGKVGRMTYSAEQGGMLMGSWDDVQFLDYTHNQLLHSDVGSGSTEIARSNAALLDPTEQGHGVGGSIAAPSGSLTTTTPSTSEPYYYSQGSVTAFGVEFARVNNFRIEVNNNLIRKDYVTDTSRDLAPYELLEGRREYRLSMTLTTENTIAAETSTTKSLWKELVVHGDYGSGFAGFDVSLVFTRSASDTITFTIPENTASAAFADQGLMLTRASHNVGSETPTTIEVEGIFRTLGTVIVDSEAVYP